MKWIKVRTNIFSDPRILLIEDMPKGDSIIVVWFKLMALAGKLNNDGRLVLNNNVAVTDEMLAIIFQRDLGLIQTALKIFIAFEMIDVSDGIMKIIKTESLIDVDDE